MTITRRLHFPTFARCPRCASTRGRYSGRVSRKHRDLRARVCDACGHRWAVGPLCVEIDTGALLGVALPPEAVPSPASG